MHSIRRTSFALLAGAFLCGCQAMRPPRDANAMDPDQETAAIRSAWMAHPASGVANGEDASLPALRQRAESIAFYNPRHSGSRYLAAVMAYQDNDRTAALHHLDDLLQLEPANAEAAALRARIALEEGNTPYAVKMLEERINLRPDSACLRETLASAYFVSGELDKAWVALGEAERLGAPKERILYNRGLIQEAQGKPAAAADSYRAALAIRPGWDLPKDRLKGLNQPLAVAAPTPSPAPAKTASATTTTPAKAPTAFPSKAPTASQTPTPKSPPAKSK